MYENSNEMFVTERNDKTMANRQTERRTHNLYLNTIKIEVQ